jgi:DNA polymerase III epsilon subunit-like protein
MKVLYFDTETTGLPKTKEPANKRPDNWPHIVSIAWIVDDNGVKHEKYFVVKPRWVITEDSIKVHNITQDIAEKTGNDLEFVINEFLNEKPDVIVAHNMNYDLNVLMNAIIWDCKMSYPIFPKLICSMTLGTNICKLPVVYSKTKYKSPKLKELYEYIFKKPAPENLHNSLVDVKILVECCEENRVLRYMIGLPNKDVLLPENVSRAKRPRTLEL